MIIDRRTFLAGAALALLGCRPHFGGLTVGSKNFTEQLVLGELLAQYLEARLRTLVDRRFYLAGTYICHQALLAGRIDMYVEYTGTAMAAVLKEKQVLTDPKQVFELVRNEYAQRFGLEVFPSLGFDNSFAMVMRSEDAQRMKVNSLLQLAAFAPQMRMGVGYEFLERPDGYNGLVKRYGLRFAEPPRVMDLGLLYRALESRQVDIVAGSNTDGLIAALKLTVLRDDLHYFPPYDAVPIVRRTALDTYAGLRAAMDGIAGRINAEEMRAMNYAVDGEKKDAAAVVKKFLADKGLL